MNTTQNQTETKPKLTPEQAREAMNKLIDDLAGDFKEKVAEIEARIATTQNHYSDYGALISGVTKNPREANIVGHALIKAGANRDGVIAGLRCFC
jgi:hypothetical protein